MRRFTQYYLSSFKGLSKEVWWLALITLINRAGAMVIPFLSLYLKEALGFSLQNVGWVMTFFGLGSIAGSYLGGWVSDKIGAYKTMVASLVGSSVLLFLAQFPITMYGVCIIVFLFMLVTDLFRPALFVAINSYAKPENQTRSVSLIRLAINLGFAVGPALGGLFILLGGYAALFWIDAITCFTAALLMVWILKPKRNQPHEGVIPDLKKGSPYKDRPFLWFALGLFLFGFAFLQYFSSIPIFYKDGLGLNESNIGLIFGLNGLLVFLLEMPLVKWCEGHQKSHLLWVQFGLILVALSFLVLCINTWAIWAWIGIIFMSVGEMFVFPFTNAYAIERGKHGKMGQYMGLYSMAFSVSHVLGHNAGLQLAGGMGFDFTYLFFTGICVLGVMVFRRIHAL